ncbi:MAG: helix-turn-helix domain-containing protein [Desulfovibrionaceae bacterium]|nr:helix-turn-helix domain-containing protein [Desulfovibrionaceae bacterium]
MTNPSNDGFVRSFARGLAVIHSLGKRDGTHTVAEVAASTKLPRTVVRRILLTLCELGYATESESRGFRLTPKILTLGTSYLTSLPFWGHAQRALETLWTQVVESCAMCVFDGRDAVFVLRIPSLKIMSLSLGVGTHVPALATAPGRAILGFQTADFLERFLDEVPLRAYTARTVCEKSALLESLACVRRDGYAWVDGEFDEYIAGLSVPVRDERLNAVASISVNLLSGETTREEAVKKYLPALRVAAHQLTGLAPAFLGTAVARHTHSL